MSLHPGDRLGPYEVIATLGAGGMGEVYRARDIRLSRDVAIKILPADVANDPDRRLRFEHEAQATARLDHPNIAAVFDVGIDRGVPYIVSELVDGRSLAERLHDGPLSPAMLRTVGAQTADALAAAHARGIIHRDIKPDNVLITKDDVVKVVDFGIAKMVATSVEATVTVTSTATAPGVVIGTASYMSPEQIRGDVVDYRTDIFSLGTMLYEMATGERPFVGPTAAETMAAILRDEPRCQERLALLPPALAATITRCLDKRPAYRFQSARDLAFSLQSLSKSTTEAANVQPARLRRTPATLASVAVVLGMFGGFALWSRPSGSGRTPTTTVRQLTFDSGVEAFPNLSRDGTLIVYAGNSTGNRDIFLRDVGARESLNLTADSVDNDSQPALSSDDRQIAFRSERDGGGIFVVARTGGPARRITRSGFNPSWSPDGVRIVTASETVDWRPDNRSPNRSQLQITDIVSGQTHTLPTDDAVQPSWSPDGRWIAYWGLWERNQRDIWIIGAEGGEPIRVTDDPAIDWSPGWSPDGTWLYFSSDRGGAMNLWRVRIALDTGKPTASPEPMNLPASWTGHARSGPQNLIIYSSFHRTSNLDRIGFDAARKTFVGPPEPITIGSNYFTNPQPSKDGNWLAFTGRTGLAQGVFVSTFAGKNIRPVSPSVARDVVWRDVGVNWNPTSDRIAFYSSRTGRYQVFTVNRDGGELKQETDFAGYGVGRAVWSNDGARVAVLETVTLTPAVFELKAAGKVTERELLPDLPDGDKFNPFAWSKDDSRLVGESYAGGLVVYSLRDRTYRQFAFRSNGGPRWLPDGRTIFSSNGDQFFAVDEVTGEQTLVGSPEPRPQDVDSRPLVTWSLSWDGRWLYRSRALFQSDIWLAVVE